MARNFFFTGHPAISTPLAIPVLVAAKALSKTTADITGADCHFIVHSAIRISDAARQDHPSR